MMTFKQLGLVIAVSSVLLTSACTSKHFKAPEYLGGKWVSAKTLNVGYDLYTSNCMQCHGVNGDGKGPASQGMNPQPRNFQQGSFKFGYVTPGELPTDDDLKRIIKYGLNGTQMLPWDISDERLDAVIQYIKTFSPVWREGKAGTVVEVSKDPWGPEHREEAILQGKKVFHGLAQCYSCHPSYATPEEVAAYSKELTGNANTEMRETPWLSINQDSQYGHKFMPPDFTKNFVKSARTPEEIYRRLNVGVNGTAMAAWKGLLTTNGNPEDSEKNQWAVAYYVDSLSKLKFDDEGRKAFFAKLDAARKPRTAQTK